MRWPTLLLRPVLAGLLLPALGLTVLRVLGPEPGLLVRWTSFAPLAIPLYAAALLLLVAKLVLPGRDSWRPWALVAAVTAAGLGVHLWWISPQFTGSAPEPAADGRLQVVTMNLLKGAADPAMVVETAAVERADVLVLQEVTPDALRELDRYGLAEAFPYRAGEPREGVVGTMAFAVHRIRAVEKLETGFDSWAMNVVTPQGQLRLYAVHTQPPTAAHEKGWGEDLDILVEAAEEDRELDLLVGDLNATGDHAPFRRLTADADLRSAAELANSGWQPTWPDHRLHSVLGVALPLVVQIDHVLVGRSMTSTETRAFSVDGSDHRAVVAEVAWR